MEVYGRCWNLLNDLRMAVVKEVQQMIEDWEDLTSQWFKSLHPDLQSVYTMNGGKTVTQVPVLMELLQRAGYPDCNTLHRELSEVRVGYHALTEGMKLRSP